MPTLTGEKLENIAYHIFCAAGAPDEHSRTVAQHLADNNLAGHDSHGFIRVIQYVRQIKDGLIIPDAEPEIVSESPSTAQVDGHYGFGQVAAKFAAQTAIKEAKEAGVSCVTVKRLGHLGRLGAYAEMAAEAGLAASLYCSAPGHAPSQAPFGGRERRLCTNPIAMAFPSNLEGPILSDFATSVAAEGKLRVYRARGHKLPDGWILDKEGRPSNDPNDFYEGGAILPVGGSVGHKGYALAFMTDVFGGILSRDGFTGGAGKQFSNGSLIVAIDIERFAPLETVRAEVSKMAEHVTDTPLAEGSHGVMYPGEKEAKTRMERGEAGVEIEQDTWGQIMALVQEYGLGETLSPMPE